VTQQQRTRVVHRRAVRGRGDVPTVDVATAAGSASRGGTPVALGLG